MMKILPRLLAVTAGATAVIVAGITPAWAETAAITVDPSAKVINGAPITVHGTGFPSGARVHEAYAKLSLKK